MTPAGHGDLRVSAGLVIPADELVLRATTGGGPGGQHVNRNATRVELRWTPAESAALAAALTPPHRDRVLRRLSRRLDGEGSLRVVAGETRSQHRNRAAALERLRTLVAAALVDPRPRRPTRPTRASVERRLADKRRRGERKERRRRPPED